MHNRIPIGEWRLRKWLKLVWNTFQSILSNNYIDNNNDSDDNDNYHYYYHYCYHYRAIGWKLKRWWTGKNPVISVVIGVFHRFSLLEAANISRKVSWSEVMEIWWIGNGMEDPLSKLRMWTCWDYKNTDYDNINNNKIINIIVIMMMMMMMMMIIIIITII